MMYSPTQYREERMDLIYEVIQNYSFATLITMTSEGPFVSHLPVLLDSAKKVLLSHCARGNPQWKHFKEGIPVTVIFNGPHAYISPAWYKPDPDNVPTWNYAAVHVKGTARIIEDFHDAYSVMNKLVQNYEDQYRTGWVLPAEPNETLKNDLNRGITVFEIAMDHVEAKFKLSQKQNSADRNSVIDNLSKSSGEQGSALAEYMKKVLTSGK
ncbi:MAG: FMN-binding negative transcriptional regulator [Bdellovibrionaceae bacterium]|nr:FMN-binding negative transcriptional regulator [Pseudobdellovibrionaceae bacterium]